MRAAVLLLLLPCLVPLASAQGVAVSGDPNVLMQPMSAPLMRDTPTTIAFETRVPCGPDDAAPPGISVQYFVAKTPAWATVSLARNQDQVAYAQCTGGLARIPNAAVVIVSSHAPAFMPDVIQVGATVTHPLSHPATARGSTYVIASFWSSLHAEPKAARVDIAPGEARVMPLIVRNAGNANTRIQFTATTSDPGIEIAPPLPLTLQSADAGGTDTEQTVPVGIYASLRAHLDAPVTVTVRYTSAYALDSKIAGDAGVVTFTVDPVAADATVDPVRHTPGVAGPLLGVVGSLGAILLRRRG